jgi:hypothetical protein
MENRFNQSKGILEMVFTVVLQWCFPFYYDKKQTIAQPQINRQQARDNTIHSWAEFKAWAQ